jgi:hypothetical protein
VEAEEEQEEKEEEEEEQQQQQQQQQQEDEKEEEEEEEEGGEEEEEGGEGEDKALHVVAEEITGKIVPQASVILLSTATRMLEREMAVVGKSPFMRKKLKVMIDIAITASVLVLVVSVLGKVKEKMAKAAKLLKHWVLQRREKRRASLAVEKLKSASTEGALRGDRATASTGDAKRKRLERTKLDVQKLFATGPFSKGGTKGK